jgi:alanine dehydrogenase
MLIGVPKEIKNHEYRVGMTPLSVREAVRHGHKLWVEAGAGLGIGVNDEDYKTAGAEIIPEAAEIFAKADMIVKVKEPQAIERKRLREGQILYTYLHLAPDPEQTKDLVKSGAICIAYETVTGGARRAAVARPDVAGRRPHVDPGGRPLPREGARRPRRIAGRGSGRRAGKGGHPRRRRGRHQCGGDGARHGRRCGDTREVHRSHGRTGGALWRRSQDALFDARRVEDECADADLVIGGVLIPGAAAPKLITRKMLKDWKNGSVFVDVAIDQGGCAETSRPTTHADPTYVVDGVIHYCVANMPGGVARTSTFALNNATLPYALAIADKGYKKALLDDVHLRNGLNVYRGKVTYKAVADVLGYPYEPAEKALAA